MKLRLVRILLVTAAASAAAQAATINWGNLYDSVLLDSKGNALDANSYNFELGAFNLGFSPTKENVESWLENWKMFDRSDYDAASGHFSSSVNFDQNGHSDTVGTDLGLNFQDVEAYVWIYNGTDPGPGTEWLLARAQNWVFPALYEDCCDTRILEWSISDLTIGDIPYWGSQTVIRGPGEGATVPADLQTLTFIPEPSSALLASMAALGMIFHRRREA